MTCNKIAFETKSDARAHKNSVDKSRKSNWTKRVRIYLCPHCCKWHFTTMALKISRSIDRKIRKRNHEPTIPAK